MYVTQDYKVKSVTEYEDRVEIEVVEHLYSRMKGWKCTVEVPEGIDVSVGDIVNLRVENHTPEYGWVLDRFIGFSYDKDRGWKPLEGME